jgi:beta-glucosidase
MHGCRPLSTRKKPDPYAKQVQALIFKMTLQEKIGQMTQISLEAMSDREDVQDWLTLDPNKLHHALVDRHIGSIVHKANHPPTIKNQKAIITEFCD